MVSLPVLVGLIGLILFGAAAHDIAFRTIPNWMPGVIAVVGATLRIAEGDLLAGLGACSLILLAAALCWRSGWLGGGDVKLIAACGLTVQPALAVPLLLDTALAGGALALIYLALGRIMGRPAAERPVGLLPRILRVERYRLARRGPLPYGSAIAAAALFVLLKA